jgi:hypothetical protein
LSMDTVAIESERQAALRRTRVRSDLDSLMGFVPAITLRARWAASDITANDLRTVRRQFARDNHPDKKRPGEREPADRRVAMANALIDATLQDLREQEAEANV